MPANGPVYHPVATGSARATVDNHTREQDLVVWAGWFCHFTQRSWIVLEEKDTPYTYRETKRPEKTNPYLKEPQFMAISPNGLVPAIQHHGKSLHDSSVVSEYLEEAFPDFKGDGKALLPMSDPYLRGVARLWVDYINKKVVPPFFWLLQVRSPGSSERTTALKDLKSALAEISSHRKGPYFFGEQFGLVNAAIALWAVREFIIHEHRGFSREDICDWKDWAEKLECRPSVAKTSSARDQYVEFNGTFLRNERHSLAGNAVSQGQQIP